MNKSRLKYYATAECVKNLAKKYIDDDSEMDLEALCKKKSHKSFLMIEDAPLKQNPVTTIYIEKYQDEFFGIKYISPFKVLLSETRIILNSIDALSRLAPQDINDIMQAKQPLKIVNDTWTVQYMGHKIACITLMMMALECFINEQIPVTIDMGVDKKGRQINKEYIERHWNLKSKMQGIKDWYYITNIRYNILMAEIIPLQKLRNEFVHLKSDQPNALNDLCADCYDNLLARNLNADFGKINEFINIINSQHQE